MGVSVITDYGWSAVVCDCSVKVIFQGSAEFSCRIPQEEDFVLCVEADPVPGKELSVAVNAIVRFAHIVLSVDTCIKAEVKAVFLHWREMYYKARSFRFRKRVCFFRV